MPTYEFRCPAGHDFEKLIMKISEAPAALPCPVCGKEAGRRISAGGGLLFKGSGFYITDYGKDGKKDQKPAAKSTASSSGESKSSSESSGSDAKGGSKSDSTSGGESKASGESKSGGESKPAAAPAPAKPSSGAE